MKKSFLLLTWLLLSSCNSSASEDISSNDTPITVEDPNKETNPPIEETPTEENTPTETKNEKRYFEEIFSEFTLETFTYGNNTTQAGKNMDLLLDLYQPKGDTKNKRPLVIYVHGGGFTQNSRTTIKGTGLLQTLAKSGFVVASIDYRLIDKQSNDAMGIGILNAVEDTRAAIRFFRKDAATDNKFKIDTKQIILGGYSAGAVTTLFTTYLNSQQKIDALPPNLSAHANANGGIEGNSGNQGYSSGITGIYNIAGGISNTALMDKNSANFIYSLHGTDDNTVNIGDTPQLKGSRLIHQKAIELGITNELNAPAGDHFIIFNCASCRKDLQTFLAQQIP